MADKQEFLNEIDEHANDLRTALGRIDTSIAANARETTELKLDREQRIRTTVQTILPELTEVTVYAANVRSPGLVSWSQVEQMLKESSATYQRQLDELGTRFDPAQAASRKAAIETELLRNEDDLRSVKAPFDDLCRVPEVTRLVDDGYGTASYPFHWLNLQYYRDWRAADKAAEQAGFDNWSMLAAQYAQQSSDVVSVSEITKGKQAELEAVQADERSSNDLRRALTEVPDKVLEQLRVKLASRISTSTATGDLVEFDQKLSDLQTQIVSLRDAQTALSKQLAELQQVRSRAAKSRKREVPDEYVTAVRQNRSSFASSGPVHSHTTYVYDNSSFYDGLLYGQMLNYFEQPSGRNAYDAGYQDRAQQDYRNDTYTSANNDRSGSS